MVGGQWLVIGGPWILVGVIVGPWLVWSLVIGNWAVVCGWWVALSAPWTLVCVVVGRWSLIGGHCLFVCCWTMDVGWCGHFRGIANPHCCHWYWF